MEADEYDKSFLRLSPDVAVITSLDPDHLDIYGTFDQMKIDYQTFAASANQLLVHKRLSADFPEAKTYSCDDNDVDYVANSIRVQDSLFYFEVRAIPLEELLDKFNTQLPGRHHMWRMLLAAISVAHVNSL